MTPLISDNLILDLKRHINTAMSETEREEYVEALKTALLIQSGAYHVYAFDEETQYAERIHTLEQLGEFGRNHPAAWAYYVLPGVSREPHELGDFDEHGWFRVKVPRYAIRIVFRLAVFEGARLLEVRGFEQLDPHASGAIDITRAGRHPTVYGKGLRARYRKLTRQ